MKKALFIVPPLLGHLRAAHSVSEILGKNGFKVIYFGPENIKAYVTSLGFDFFISSTIPFGLNLDVDIAKSQGLTIPYLTRLKNKLKDDVYEKRKNELIQALALIKPDLVFIDAYLSTDFIPSYKYLFENSIKVCFLQTMLSCYQYEGIPYIDSSLKLTDRTKIYLEELERKFRRIKNNFISKIIYLGYDDNSQIKYRIKSEGFCTNHYPLYDNYLFLSFRNIPELITAPFELELSKRKKEFQYYLGLVTPSNQQLLTDYPDLNSIICKAKNAGKIIIYISFGSVYVNRLNCIVTFIIKINSILSQEPGMVGIFSLGGQDINLSGIDLKYLHIFKFIPQLALLHECDIFITHGGLNSIKESISTTTPMIAYPLEIDQFGNAQKIEFKNIGLLGDINKDSKNDIWLKIKLLLTDKSFKESIKLFKEICINQYDEEKIILDLLGRY
ncbi:glycosyltransferase [Aquirufa aurantiipilula]|uniref:glycosyltransferase n=1 Tax=Aquirufa aurantiipilula TaxID=2696561 RepID=UPI001CAA80F2|nr:glycosyltransferase [Aquirufa aurantiipilula]MBZ1327214.1 glycosyltransferase family 1 protein [Aquirufa aurantiipilula]